MSHITTPRRSPTQDGPYFSPLTPTSVASDSDEEEKQTKETAPTPGPLHDTTTIAQTLEAVGKMGYRATIPLPEDVLTRRGSLWRNILINPHLNPKSMPLARRWETQTWHKNHRAPRHAQNLIDEMSLLLSHLYDQLQPYLRRIRHPDNKCRRKENFVRQYGASLCTFARKATEFWHENDALKWDTTETLLQKWLHLMLVPRGKRFRNQIEWNNFYLTEVEIDNASFVASGKACVSLGRYMRVSV